MKKIDFIQANQAIYLDNASFSIVPQDILLKLNDLLNYHISDIGNETIKSIQTKNQYFKSKETVSEFINCNVEEVIYTKNTTESINIIANGIAKQLNEGDEIVLTQFEHDSNFLIWQKIAKEKKLKINFVKFLSNGQIDFDDLKYKITLKTKIASISGCSNIIGYMQDLKKISQIIKEKNKDVFINYDLASYIPYKKVDVNNIKADSICFSAHKLYSPICMGILYLNSKALSHFENYNLGNGNVSKITKNDYLLNKDYKRLESGSLNLIGAFCLKNAIKYIEEIGYDKIEEHSKKIVNKFINFTKENNNFTFITTQKNENHIPIFSFNITNIPDKKIIQLLDEHNIIGAHGNFGNVFFLSQNNIESVVRLSFGIFIEDEDLDYLFDILTQITQ